MKHPGAWRREWRRHQPAALGLALLLLAATAASHETDGPAELPPAEHATGSAPCEDGFADVYPCHDVDLLARLPLAELGGGSGSDLWGWTDPRDGTEYAIFGRSSGTSFVDLRRPHAPRYLGELPSRPTPGALFTVWRDVKVYRSHAYIVADSFPEADLPGHGLQIFDLRQLRRQGPAGRVFRESAHYGGFAEAHNIAINEETGFAYVLSSDTCDGGMHMLDLRRPRRPVFVGCVDQDGTVHDAQCVVYRGADRRYRGEEICFNSNEDAFTIVDVTRKSSPVQLSRSEYAGSGYVHQGWLSENHRYFVLGDEGDEIESAHGTRSYVWDLRNLRRPVLLGHYEAPTASVDHNLYTHRGLVYQANYTAGLRLLRPLAPRPPFFRETAFFDVYPPSDALGIVGAWSVYPFFASGTVIVSGVESGLFVLRPRLHELGPTPHWFRGPEDLRAFGQEKKPKRKQKQKGGKKKKSKKKSKKSR